VVNARELLAKAIRASSSAALLPGDGDINGACNRAYYAMFDGARTAPLAAGAPVDPNLIRTHNGVIAAFALHLIKAGQVQRDWGVRSTARRKFGKWRTIRAKTQRWR
jgi:uncharacterized protein (UPF0332 family)